MKLSTRYGLCGIAALAALSAVQWLRTERPAHGEVAGFLLGVAPNVFAAAAIAFVLLGAWTDRRRPESRRAAARMFFVAAFVAGAGLTGWEFVQRASARFVFDPADLVATWTGLALSTAVFFVVTPREPRRTGVDGRR